MTDPRTEAGRHFLLLLSQGPRREGDAATALAAILYAIDEEEKRHA